MEYLSAFCFLLHKVNEQGSTGVLTLVVAIGESWRTE